MSKRARHLAADGCLKTPLKLIGAKTGAAADSTRSRIYKMLPDGITTYIEPFIGSGAIMMGKKRHQIEKVNDLNPFVINYFRCLKKDPDRLWEQMQRYVGKMSEEKFKEIRGNAPAEPFAAAGWYYAINKFARNGIVRFNKQGICNSTWCGTTEGRGLLDEDWYDRIYNRVRDVQFQHKDYKKFLETAIDDPANSVVILDPPYMQVFTMYYTGRFAQKDHKEMAKILRSAKFYWLLTINDHPLIWKWYKPFNFFENEVFYSCSNTSPGRGRKEELIITNYDVKL